MEYISEAEYLEDAEFGYEYFFDLEDIDARCDIEDDRARRLNNLKGKYIIVCDGKSSKKTVYLQDQRISKGGYWTNYMANAISFKTKVGASNEINKFKYNKPRIALIDGNLKLNII